MADRNVQELLQLKENIHWLRQKLQEAIEKYPDLENELNGILTTTSARELLDATSGFSDGDHQRDVLKTIHDNLIIFRETILKRDPDLLFKPPGRKQGELPP